MTINEQIRSLCSRLRLYALPRLLESEAHLAQEQGKTHVEFLHDLLAREVQERDSKDFQRRLKAAALPARHDLDLFDHNYSQGITAPRLRDLRRLGWLEQNYNLILMGPSGTGKTFIAAGLVYEAVGQGYKAYMVTMEDVINTIKMKSLMPSAMSAYNRLLKADLVAIDDIMLFPVKKEDAAGFFNLINTLHEKASLIITTNKAPTEWAKTLDDPAKDDQYPKTINIINGGSRISYVDLTLPKNVDLKFAYYSTFGDVNVDLCKKFREYLLNAKQLKHSNRPISLNSASGYYSTFRGLLKIAYRDKWFRENINDYLDKIEPQDVKKEYLTLEEVKQLASTPCDIPVLKAASLFACLTGLRISDILNLQWEDFTIAPDQGYCLRIRTQKTQTEATLPISYEAYELCGTPGTGKVFKDLKRSMINYPLKSWLKKAGITKPITFHGFRHSYAVIQISLGTDIYTVSKMLTHKNVSTTQIYADLVNFKKRETANKISLK